MFSRSNYRTRWGWSIWIKLLIWNAKRHIYHANIQNLSCFPMEVSMNRQPFHIQTSCGIPISMGIHDLTSHTIISLRSGFVLLSFIPIHPVFSRLYQFTQPSGYQSLCLHHAYLPITFASFHNVSKLISFNYI